MTLLGLVMLAAACVPAGKSDPCAGWEPIRLHDASIDGLTDQDAGEILAHNEFGRARNCW
jgi:hypothetical protein